MRLVILFPWISIATFFIECVVSIPHIETKSWIRTRRESPSRVCVGPDCMAQDEPREDRSCTRERTERRRLARLTLSNEYIPECHHDGTFAPVQCHPGTKACWCVLRNGKPITGSTVFNRKPNCFMHRQGRNSTMSRRSSSRTKKRRRACNHGDRTKFNTALVKVFRSEFNRFRSLTSSHQDSDPNDDRVVLAWKFDHLDKNTDGLLYRNETNNLKRLVKQQIRPRPCANSFIPVCAKGDKKITKLEWLDCLRVEEIQIKNLPFDTFKSLVDSGSRGLHQLRPVPGSTGIVLSPNRKNSDSLAETSGCWSDRQSALTSQQLDSNKSIIIPECTPDGKYQKTQCAQGRSYCWCVNEITGLEISDTVTVNSIPNCDRLMKGCIGRKKERFITNLLGMFTKTMTQEGQRRLRGNSRSNLTVEEQAAKWNFQRLDTNKNGFLDRREWKAFRRETATERKLKRCGKKFPRYCDGNMDKKISMSEWNHCLQLRRTTHSSRRTSQRSSGGLRTGKNPFTTILQR